MLDLSSIKSQKLKEAIRNSHNFSMLTEEEKKSYLEEIVQFPEKEQGKLCKIFEEEVFQKSNKELLSGFVDSLRGLKRLFFKTVTEKQEKVEKHESEENIRKLLSQLNKI